MAHDDDHDAHEFPSMRDYRLDLMSPSEPQASVVIGDREMRLRFERIHRRLLERATGGLLTWRGDEIVRTARASRRVRAAASLRLAHASGTKVASSTHDSPMFCPDNRQNTGGSVSAMRAPEAIGQEGDRDAMCGMRSDDERDPVGRHAHGGLPRV